MAKKLKPDDGPATRNHNSADIKQAIREVADVVILLKGQRAEINGQITEARGRLKSFGIKMLDFNAVLRLYELEAEDRNESVDNMKIAFEALGIGGQADLFPEPAAATGNGASTAPKPFDATKVNQAGVKAGLAGKDQSSNPHPADSEPHDYWDRGWLGGQKTIAAQMKPGGGPSPEPPMAA